MKLNNEQIMRLYNMINDNFTKEEIAKIAVANLTAISNDDFNKAAEFLERTHKKTGRTTYIHH